MKYLLIILLVFTLLSCEKKSINTFGEFPNEFKLKGNIENEIPYKLGALGIHDTLLIAAGLNVTLGNKLVTIYNLNEMDNITQRITVGNGPHEVNFAIGSKIEFGNIYIYDLPRKKLYQYDILSLMNENGVRTEYEIDEDLLFFDFLPEQNFLLSCPNKLDSKSLITYIDYNGKIKKSIPNKTKAYPPNIDERTFKSVGLYSYIKHPNSELYAFSFRYTDRIYVIDNKGEIVNSCQGPLVFNQTPNSNENQIEAYRTIRCNNDFIFASYFGESLSHSNNKKLPELSTQINIFNWECEPIAQLILDHDVMDFVIDDINHKIITWCPTTGTIVTYKLPSLNQY